MRPLFLHPSTPQSAASRVEADALRLDPSRVALRFRIVGALENIRLPPPGPPVRTDELWRRTCLEAFLRPPGEEAYHELNLSPSTAWAAYRFDGYRRGMARAEALVRIHTASSADVFELQAEVALEGDARLARADHWSVGLSAVIEGADGSIAYWALAHPAGKPDFHHRDCFALDLPATGLA